MESIIKMTQSAIIEQRLEEFGKKVEQQIAELNIENQVATSETISTLKKMRADLKKNAEIFESQRKSLKSAVMKPYEEFEELYKVHIIEKFKKADELLKSKISSFESIIKKEKRESLMQYFSRLQEKYAYEFLKHDRCIPGEILLGTSEKKYKEEILKKFEQVESDLKLIETQAYASEILVEYKKTLNCSQAVVAVTQRKEAEKEEAEKRSNVIVAQRGKQLQEISFTWSEEEQAYKSKLLGLSITYADVRSLPVDEWFYFYKPAYNRYYSTGRGGSIAEVTEEAQAVEPQTQAAPPAAVNAQPAETPQEIELRFRCMGVLTPSRFEAFRTEIKEIFSRYSITYKNI